VTYLELKLKMPKGDFFWDKCDGMERITLRKTIILIEFENLICYKIVNTCMKIIPLLRIIIMHRKYDIVKNEDL